MMDNPDSPGTYDPRFAFLTVAFFTKAAVFPGSIGSFRYRFQRFSWPGKEDARIQAWVYGNICFELAEDAETMDFPWTEEGVADLRVWLSDRLRERGAEPYRIPYPPGRSVSGTEPPGSSGSEVSGSPVSDKETPGSSGSEVSGRSASDTVLT